MGLRSRSLSLVLGALGLIESDGHHCSRFPSCFWTIRLLLLVIAKHAAAAAAASDADAAAAPRS